MNKVPFRRSRRMASILTMTILAVSVAGCCLAEPSGPGVAIATGPTGKAYLTYEDKPLLAFGPGDEMRLLSGAADLERWAAWQKANGMNLLRAYPASVPVEAYGAPGLHPFVREGDRWNVDRWNDNYFKALGQAAAIMEAHDIVLHLQLWQIVWFKGGSARWDINYLNPRNNVNEWTQAFGRGRDYIDAPPGSPARAHQEKWVRKILDAVAPRKNVWIDVINELGNEMGTLEWAAEVSQWIRRWEGENGRRFLVGVDSEHHYRPEVFGPFLEHFDLIILNELRNPAHARNAIAAFNLPAVTVRSSDDRNQWDHYVFANAEQTGPEHETRYRTLCYRSLFSGVQSIGAYWKPEITAADYRDLENWPSYAQGLRKFWQHLAPHWPALVVDDSVILGESVTPHAYGLRGPDLLAIYLECGPKTWNNVYPPSELQLHCPFEQHRVELFHPRTGVFQSIQGERSGDTLTVQLDGFTDDLVILVRKEAH